MAWCPLRTLPLCLLAPFCRCLHRLLLPLPLPLLLPQLLDLTTRSSRMAWEVAQVRPFFRHTLPPPRLQPTVLADNTHGVVMVTVEVEVVVVIGWVTRSTCTILIHLCFFLLLLPTMTSFTADLQTFIHAVSFVHQYQLVLQSQTQSFAWWLVYLFGWQLFSFFAVLCFDSSLSLSLSLSPISVLLCSLAWELASVISSFHLVVALFFCSFLQRQLLHCALMKNVDMWWCWCVMWCCAVSTGEIIVVSVLVNNIIENIFQPLNNYFLRNQ